VDRIDFRTFLNMTGNQNLEDFLCGWQDIQPIPKAIATRLAHLVRIHMAIGGLLPVVDTWIESHDFSAVDAALDTQIARIADICAEKLHLESKRSLELCRHVPKHMARENTHFHNSRQKGAAEGLSIDPLILQLLEDQVLVMVRRVERPQDPIDSYIYQSQYKYYFSDTGVFRRLAGLPASSVDSESPSLSRFRGILTESYILQSLRQICGDAVWYWKSGNRAEVDFVIQHGKSIVPVEVKTARNVKSHSLALYRQLYAPEIALRFSLLNLKSDDDLLNIPIYMAGHTPRLIQLATTTGAHRTFATPR